MAEIEPDRGNRGNEIEESRSNRSNSTAEITLKKIGPSPPSRLIVPSSIKVHDLRKLIAQNGDLPSENLTLIWRGNVLHNNKNGNDVIIQLKNGDSLIVATKPKPPPKRADDGLDDDDDHELRFQLPQSITGWKRRLFIALREKLKLPDILLMAMVSLSVKMWILIVLWFILAPVAQKLDLGPLYVLATGFAIIFYNLGQRQPGDVSAYSIFNEDFRELPGTLNAERLDRDIRAGQF